MQFRIMGLPKGKMYAALCVPLMSGLIATSLMGQEGLSTLRGTISDKSGAVVAGVAVSAREVLTNVVARTATSDSQGNFEMPGLKTGSYQVTASLAGFKKSVVEHGAALGIEVEIVQRNPSDVGFVVQPTRWRVEQTFGILMYFRRLVKDYESNPRSSESRVLWSITAVMGRRLTCPATVSWHGPKPVEA